MKVPISFPAVIDTLERFVARGSAAQSAVDRAIDRAYLVRKVATRKHALVAMRLKRDDDVTDAQLRLAMAETALEDFDAALRIDELGPVRP